MVTLLISAVLLSLKYSVIPNHWLQYGIIGRLKGWDRYDVMVAATLAVGTHFLATLCFAAVNLYIDSSFLHNYEGQLHWFGVGMFGVFGIVFLLGSVITNVEKVLNKVFQKQKNWLILFCIILFFSPCEEIHYLLSGAQTYGWDAMTIIVLMYAIISLLSAMLLSYLTFKIIPRGYFANISQTSRNTIIGVTLLIISLLTYLWH